MSGQTYNHLHVVGFIEIKNNLAQWKCKCKLCETELVVSSTDITSGNKKSCGCLKRPNIVGAKTNRLIVVGLLKNRKNGERQWECLCECGETTSATTAQITKSAKQSCGCAIRENMVENVYGFLEVLSYSHSVNDRAYWLCKCVCGSLTKVSASNLRSDQIKLCGCLSKNIRKETNLLRYGVENVMHNSKLALKAAKAQNNSFILKHWKTRDEVVCVASYEKKVVEYFNVNKIDYKWQHKTFNIVLPSGKKTTYRPDLYLVGRKNPWVEIKGYFRKGAKEKWDIFHNKIKPNSQLWDKEKLKELGIL